MDISLLSCHPERHSCHPERSEGFPVLAHDLLGDGDPSLRSG